MKEKIRNIASTLFAFGIIAVLFSGIAIAIATATDNTFQYPLDIPWNESRGFGLNWWINNWDGNGSSGYHLGVDIPADPLIKVKAASDGIVIFAGPKKGYGNVVIIKHPNSDVTTLYGHLGKGLNVSNKNSVSKGQIIGYVGNSSENGGWLFTHLHFGIRKGLDSINANVCGNWPYVGYSQPCKKFTHEQQVDMWYNSSEFINEHLLPPIPPNQKLTVISPNGGENWPAGSEQKIQWKFTGKPITSVKIELQKGILLTETIAVFAPTDYSGDGAYLWTIPTTQNTGIDYKIIVISAAKSKNIDTSDGYFTISAPTPTPIPTPNPTPVPTPTPTPAPIGLVHNVNKNTDYTAIQTAIDDANIGDEILVSSGTYYENVNVSKRLILRGIDNGGGKPVMDAKANGSAITLSANGIILEGFAAINTSWLNAGINVTTNSNIIRGNNISINYLGICIVSSNNNTLSNNTVFNNYQGIHLYQSNQTILSGNKILNNDWGVYLVLSNNNTLSENIALHSYNFGIGLEMSSNNNTLIGNVVNSNNFYGIKLSSSNGNILIGNDASNNVQGISIVSSINNVMHENNISNNFYGMYLYVCDNNKIYHNNFVNNTEQAYFEYNLTNKWDSGYPDGGNYWSDYNGTDLNNGINQDQPGSDGIGDTPYNIRGHLGGGSYGYVQDRYPLMNPYG